jgi:hypothetical protein
MSVEPGPQITSVTRAHHHHRPSSSSPPSSFSGQSSAYRGLVLGLGQREDLPRQRLGLLQHNSNHHISTGCGSTWTQRRQPPQPEHQHRANMDWSIQSI